MASSFSGANAANFDGAPNPELLRQIQLGLNAFWLMQRFAEGGQTMPSSGDGGIFPSYPPQLMSNFVGIVAEAVERHGGGGQQEMMEEEEAAAEEEEKQQSDEPPPALSPMEGKAEKEQEEAIPEGIAISPTAAALLDEVVPSPPVRPSVLDRRWEFVDNVKSFAEFEHLRCLHQVSRNRTFAYGIRYSCTQKTQMRSNCSYLLVCIFAEGAGEHSQPGVGKISVYSRNAHTHPVKAIKRRQPRSVARQAKRERERVAKEMKERRENDQKMMVVKGQEKNKKEKKKEEEEEKEKEVEEGEVEGGNGQAMNEEEEEEIQILEQPGELAPPSPSTSSAALPSAAAALVEDDGKNEQQSKLMELLAELQQHFVSSAAKEKRRNNRATDDGEKRRSGGH